MTRQANDLMQRLKIDDAMPLEMGIVSRLVEQSPFQRWQSFHYWENCEFTERRIDYSLGTIRRTPQAGGTAFLLEEATASGPA